LNLELWTKASLKRVLGDMTDVHKILFVTLSNIGDVILTLPALDVLRERFTNSQITIITGPRSKEIFENSPYIDRLIIYDKYSRLRDKIKLFQELKKSKFDLVIDLRNTLYGALLPAHHRTSPFLYIPKHIQHMKDRNLYRLQMVLRDRRPLTIEQERLSVFLSADEEHYVNSILQENGITIHDRIIIVSPAAGGYTRRWERQKFVNLCAKLSEDYKVILVATKANQPAGQYIRQNCPNKIFDFTGETTLGQLTYLLKRSILLITCDTGTLQLASYLNTPIVALFGPSDEKKYGPWSNNYRVVSKEIFCRPCKKARCRFKTVECMSLIKVEDVLRQVREVLAPSSKLQAPSHSNIFKRILIVRTDRIGDVLLSTPSIKALRDAYPSAYIAMMVSPYTKDVLEGNPYLDEIIVYDKDAKHKSWLDSVQFTCNLKKKRFDLALILHPTNRVHLITFFAGIHRRVGYNKKLGFLLTDRIKHTKQLGEKHELEYNLDLVRFLGIEPRDKGLFMPLKPEAEKWAQELLNQEGIKETDKLLVLHPGASCPSKIWPNDRFAQVADKLIDKYGFKALIVAGPKDTTLAENVVKKMHNSAINLAGQISVSQLASILKRCQLFISNDSGPVHIASALNSPVISIFGRKQPGLGPKRWGPLGMRNRVIHKEAGCIRCLAHDCTKEFACLKAINVEDVLEAADSILGH
jgi:heptosyltransferase-2